MAKIDIARIKSGNRHTVNVVLSFEDNHGSDQKTTESMRVVYRGVSLREGHAIEERFNTSEDKRAALINTLVENVLELPDLIDNGAVVLPTAEFFETLDTYYLNRINQAIKDDREGNA